METSPRVAPDHRRHRSSLMNDLGTGTSGGSATTRPEQTGVRRPHARKMRRRSTDAVHEEGLRRNDSWLSDGFLPGGSPQSSSDEELDGRDGRSLDDDEETGLTENERHRRWKRKRRINTLDSRIVGLDGRQLSAMEKDLMNQSILRKSIINAGLIGLWYFFSLSISIYNKWMFSPDQLNFHFPLFTTSLHMLVQFSLASLVLRFVPRFRPRHDSLSNPHAHEHDHNQDSLSTSDKPLMTRLFYLTRIGPCGAATGLDIGLGNMSLRFITLTFYTMCKSSSLAFVLLFAFLFRLESPSVRLCLIILTMTMGVIMMVFGETLFSLPGFLLVISASLFSGFRWALTQILLLRNPATSNPFSSIFFLAPVMFVSILVIAIPVEGPRALVSGLAQLLAARGLLATIAILLFPGLLAFLMTSSEFALLQRTSVVTLSICGIFKEVVTISAAGIVFHDSLTLINVSGLLVTITSIAAYNWIKIRNMRELEAEKGSLGAGREGEELQRSRSSDGSASVPSGNFRGGGARAAYTAVAASNNDAADDEVDEEYDDQEHNPKSTPAKHTPNLGSGPTRAREPTLMQNHDHTHDSKQTLPAG